MRPYYPLLFIFLISLLGSIPLWRTQRSKRAFIGPAMILLVFLVGEIGWGLWRHGRTVAQAEFDIGDGAPFSISVREVPVPVTKSHHFIVTLYRGEYPVTSFRYFWVNYTPTEIKIDWPQLESFTVTFDGKYVACCRWSWGSEASWSITSPPGAPPVGMP